MLSNNSLRLIADAFNNLGEPSYGSKNIFFPSSDAKPCPAKKTYISVLPHLVERAIQSWTAKPISTLSALALTNSLMLDDGIPNFIVA